MEIYSKNMENLIEYKEGVFERITQMEVKEGSFTFGSGASKGIEVFIKKVKGKSTGWIGYTYSKTDRIFEKLNDGLNFLQNMTEHMIYLSHFLIS